MHETLDETIDRVAGEMTEVGADAAVAERVRAGIAEPRRSWLVPAMAASVAMAVVFATGLWPRVELDETPDAARREVASHAVAPVAPLAPAQELVWRNQPARPVVEEAVTPLRDRASRSTVDLDEAGTSPKVEDSAPVPPQLAAAWVDAGEPEGPAPLEVAELIIAPMPVSDIPDMAPLRIESLQIAEIDFEQAKEPR